MNIGFAALTMNAAIGLTASSFGVGASIFFVGYTLLEVPSNLILAKVGARRWIARIMISWRIVSAGMALVSDTNSFYLGRFLLGVAEAGFFPGIIFYLTSWFPAAYRARMVGIFLVGIPLSGLVGSPLSTTVMSTLNGAHGLQGWQWMFILEGVPSVLLGIACLWILPDRPADLSRLSAQERVWLEATLDRERLEKQAVRDFTVGQVLTNGKVLALAAALFLITSALFGSIYWMPQVVKTFGLSNLAVGWASAIPYLLAVPVMILWTRHSDRTEERAWHVIGPVLLPASGFVLAGLFIATPILAILGLAMACTGIYAALPVFWSLPAAFLGGSAAAVGIALISAIGNFSGSVAPAVIGWSKDVTGGFTAAMYGRSLALIVAGSLIAMIGRKRANSLATPTG